MLQTCPERQITLLKTMILRCRAGLPLPPRRGWEAYRFHCYALVCLVLFSCTYAAVPRFFESNRMAVLLLPPDTEVDSIIYRLRAEDTDRDYPLIFQIKGAIGVNLIRIEAHECTPSTNIFCEADVYLWKPVERGRLYIFNLTVSDQNGLETEVTARIDTTNGRATPTSQIFIKYSPTIEVKEDMPPRTVISTMIVRKRQRSTFGEFQVLGPARHIFQMTPANLVSNNSLNGTLSIERKVDFEEANLHTFKVCLLQPYTNINVDTRNIACVLVSVVVKDVQDEPPLFTKAPPVTRVPATAVEGDVVARVKAKDGDRGTPRPLRYSILPSSSLYTKYFRMDDKTGVITMNETATKLREKMISLDPILMTVTAEEVTTSLQNYPALSTSVEIAFVVLDAEFLIPKFMHESYVAEVYENSVPDTELVFNSPFLVHSVKGLFALELEGVKGAFSVHPGVIKDSGNVKIKVKNSFLLDYEKSQQINFKLVARQVTGRQDSSAMTDISVRVIDVNDNVPQFSQTQYEVEIYENITGGTSILRVHATDEDSGEFGIVRYVSLSGKHSEKLYLDPTTGVISCSSDDHGFDREMAAEYFITVEAKDNNGQGSAANTATAKIILRLKDINDSTPRFVESFYKGVLSPDLQQLKDPIIVRAIDLDAERPNNEVIYNLVKSAYSDFFFIDRNTGRLDTNRNYLPRFGSLKSDDKGGTSRNKRAIDENDTVINLYVKATDLGFPSKSSEVNVKIFKQEYGERVIRFIYPKSKDYVDAHKGELEDTLDALTGGSTEIVSTTFMDGTGSFLNPDIDPYRSIVTALVRFDVSTTVDVEKLMLKLNVTQLEKLKIESKKKTVAISALQGKRNSYLTGVIFLCIILVIIIIIVILCFCCEGCMLYRVSKSAVGDDGSEGVSYVRVEDTERYRGVKEDIFDTPNWWQCLPVFARDLLLCCGYIPPGGKKGSRVAWSGDERRRERVGKIVQPPQGNGVQDRGGGMMQAMQRNQQSLMLEDVDGGRGQMMGRQGAAEDPNGQFSEPRRVYVLKDTMGIPREGNALNEGNTYLLEDIENQPRNAGYPYPHDAMFQPGNSEILRQHANPHDAAIFSEDQRRVRRVDVGSEEAVLMHDDAGGGQRKINNQYVNQIGVPNQGHYTNDGRWHDQRNGQNGYLENGSYIQHDGNRQSKRYDDDGKDKNRAKGKNNQPTDPNLVDRSTDPLDRNTKSARSSNIPGTYGYQHTKTSILRYESNKAKIEEEREESMRQGKDPDDLCHTHQGTGVILASESKKGSMRDREGKTVSKLEAKRNQNQFSMPGGDIRLNLERRGSLPEIETNLEKEAARRIQIRRNSGGIQGQNEEAYNPIVNNRDNVNYEGGNERREEIERRTQQRRSEASEAISGELHRSNVDPQYYQHAGPQQHQNIVPQHQNIVPQQHQNIGPQHQNIGLQQHQNIVPQQHQNIGPQQHQNIVPQQHQNNGPQQLQNIGPQHHQLIVPPQHDQHHQQMALVDGNQVGAIANAFPQTHLQGQQPRTINIAPINPEDQMNYASDQAANQRVMYNNADPNTPMNNTNQGTNNGNINAVNMVSKESIEQAVAAALVNMAITNNGNLNSTFTGLSAPANSTNNLNNPSPSHATNAPHQTGAENPTGVLTTEASNINTTLQENNMNSTELNIKNLNDKSIVSELNINNEVEASTVNYEQPNAQEGEINLAASTIFEKNLKNDASILNIPTSKRKRNRLLEKKSVFTIAYDGMKTDQLRPESAAQDP